MLHHRRQERVFFRIMEVARCAFDLRDQLDHPCRIAVKEARLGRLGTISFEAN